MTVHDNQTHTGSFSCSWTVSYTHLDVYKRQSFGYVAGWSSGRELAELKASLEIIRNTAHELISALDEHLAELRQQRETELSTAQEAAFALDNGNTLFIQTCDSGYDYTLYGCLLYTSRCV